MERTEAIEFGVFWESAAEGWNMGWEGRDFQLQEMGGKLIGGRKLYLGPQTGRQGIEIGDERTVEKDLG